MQENNENLDYFLEDINANKQDLHNELNKKCVFRCEVQYDICENYVENQVNDHFLRSPNDFEMLHRPNAPTAMNTTKSTIYSIEKRNARERCRVRAVNEAFVRLRQAIPSIAARQKRVSKVKTLQKALEYIMDLEFMLNSYC